MHLQCRKEIVTGRREIVKRTPGRGKRRTTRRHEDITECIGYIDARDAILMGDLGSGTVCGLRADKVFREYLRPIDTDNVCPDTTVACSNVT